MAVKLKGYYEDEFKKGENRINAAADEQIRQTNENYDKSNEHLTNIADRQVIAGSNSYDSAYNDNAVMKAINERQIKDSMANAGLSDSGLNRTQLTAVGLQKANADNNVSMQKNAFINKIRSALQENIYNNEVARGQQINTINNQRTADINTLRTQQETEQRNKMEEIINNIASMTDPTQAAAYIKTVSKQYGVDPYTLAAYSPVVTKKNYDKYLESESYFTNRDGYKGTYDTVAGIDTTSAAGQTLAAKQIKNASTKYSLTKTQIKKLCASAGISYSDYNKFLKNGNLFKEREDKAQLDLQLKLKKVSGSSTGGSSSRRTGKKSSSGSSNYNLGNDDDTAGGEKKPKKKTNNSGLNGVTDYDSAIKYINDNGGKNASGLMTRSEFARGYKEVDNYSSYTDYLKDYCRYATSK